MTDTAAHPDLARPSLGASLVVALRDIKLAHSVFALPFAIAGAFLVAHAPDSGLDGGRFGGQLLLVIACMVAARTWAMLFNRLADRRIDAENPRTARRPVASGSLSARRGGVFALASAAVFVGLCSLFWIFFGNAWPLALSVPVLLWIAFYSLTKRFTALCHLFLGGALALSPLASAIAVGGLDGLVAHLPTLGALALFVLFWVGGFDIAYALQDLDFDRSRGLRSVPAALGWRGALWTSRLLHVLAIVSLAWIPSSDTRLGVLTVVGISMTGALLCYEHVVLHRRGLAGLPMVFFTLNGVVSVVLGALITLDVLI